VIIISGFHCIYNVSYNEKREIAIFMLDISSVFSVFVKWTDDGSLLEQKLIATIRLHKLLVVCDWLLNKCTFVV